MPIEIIVPRLGWSMEEGAFVAWLKQDGDLVRAGDPLFSIEGDKAVQDIESIDGGILHIAANGPKPGAPVCVGDVLGHLVSPEPVPPKAGPPTAARPAIPTAPLESKSIVRPSPLPIPPPVEGQTQGVTPLQGSGLAISPRAMRVAGELGVDWTVVRGSGRRGRIRERDIHAAVSSARMTGTLLHPIPAQEATRLMPSVLVTGGCGFIGTWVVHELLDRGLTVVVLDAGTRPGRWERVLGARAANVSWVQGSLLDREMLARVFAEHQVSHVIHLAALLTPDCQADPWEGCRVNVLGSVALLEQIRRSAHRIQGFSYASSVTVFGEDPGPATGSSDSGNQPLTLYGAFKKSVELITAQYWRQFQVASVGIRPQVAYGPEREVGLTAGPSLAARAAARGEAYCIGYTGRIGYDYVGDVARALVRGALETPPGAHVVDLPGGMADVAEVIAAIGAAVPDAKPNVTMDGPAIAAHAPSHPHYISTIFPDWKTTSLAEGMRRTVAFYRVSLPE